MSHNDKSLSFPVFAVGLATFLYPDGGDDAGGQSANPDALHVIARQTRPTRQTALAELSRRSRGC